MRNLSELRDELDRRDPLGTQPMDLYWYLYLGDDEPAPLCRACILDLDEAARFEGDPEPESTRWKRFFAGIEAFVGVPGPTVYRRVLPCHVGGAAICQNEFTGTCLSRAPVGTCNED